MHPIETDIQALNKKVAHELNKMIGYLEEADESNGSGSFGQKITQLTRKIEGEEETLRVLKIKSIKERICPALETFTGDIWDLSKIITAVIVTLRVKSPLPTSLVLPTPISLISIIIFMRMTIAEYCK